MPKRHSPILIHPARGGTVGWVLGNLPMSAFLFILLISLAYPGLMAPAGGGAPTGVRR